MKNQELKRNIRRLNNISYNIKIAYDRIKEWNDKLVKLTKEQSKLKKEMEEKAKGYVLDIYEQAVEYIDNVLTEEYGPEVTAEFNKIKPILNEKLNGFSDYNYCQLFIIPDNSDYTEYITKQQAVNRLTTALCHLSIKLLNGYKLIDVTIENSLHFKIEPEGTFTFNVFN